MHDLRSCRTKGSANGGLMHKLMFHISHSRKRALQAIVGNGAESVLVTIRLGGKAKSISVQQKFDEQEEDVGLYEWVRDSTPLQPSTLCSSRGCPQSEKARERTHRWSPIGLNVPTFLQCRPNFIVDRLAMISLWTTACRDG